MPHDPAAESYDWWAKAYDECNPENDYELWLGRVLLPQVKKLGVQRGWALDLGCGTGRSFPPLLKRGWRVVGCDSSVGMLTAAERKFGKSVPLLNLDARELPSISTKLDQPAQDGFDLVLMLNDVVNYLTDDGDLGKAFAGVKRNLHPLEGLAVLDANSLALFQRDYGLGVPENLGATDWRWRGVTEQCAPEQIYEGELQDPSGLTRVHRQRHWSRIQIEDALATSGLRSVAVMGQREESGEIQLSASPSESRDLKLLYFVSHQ